MLSRLLVVPQIKITTHDVKQQYSAMWMVVGSRDDKKRMVWNHESQRVLGGTLGDDNNIGGCLVMK